MIYHWISMSHNITLLVFPEGDGLILGWRGPRSSHGPTISSNEVYMWLRDSAKCHSIERCVCG